MSHTPLPWMIGHAGNSIQIEAFEPDGNRSLQVLVSSNDVKNDAAFIVKACNAHYGLVEALKKISEEALYAPCHHIMVIADAAIAALKDTNGTQ